VAAWGLITRAKLGQMYFTCPLTGPLRWRAGRLAACWSSRDQPKHIDLSRAQGVVADVVGELSGDLSSYAPAAGVESVEESPRQPCFCFNLCTSART
jgi:hypothetical protein